MNYLQKVEEDDVHSCVNGIEKFIKIQHTASRYDAKFESLRWKIVQNYLIKKHSINSTILRLGINIDIEYSQLMLYTIITVAMSTFQ